MRAFPLAPIDATFRPRSTGSSRDDMSHLCHVVLLLSFCLFLSGLGSLSLGRVRAGREVEGGRGAPPVHGRSVHAAPSPVPEPASVITPAGGLFPFLFCASGCTFTFEVLWCVCAHLCPPLLPHTRCGLAAPPPPPHFYSIPTPPPLPYPHPGTGVQPNSHCLNSVVAAFGAGRRWTQALRLVETMEKAYGVPPDRCEETTQTRANKGEGRLGGRPRPRVPPCDASTHDASRALPGPKTHSTRATHFYAR